MSCGEMEVVGGGERVSWGIECVAGSGDLLALPCWRRLGVALCF